MDWEFAVKLSIGGIAVCVALWALWLGRALEDSHLLANGKMDDVESMLAKQGGGCNADNTPRV